MKLLSFGISYHWDKEIFLLPVHSSHGSEQELRRPWNRLNSGSILIWTSSWTWAVELQQWSIFFSALSQHENWPTQAVQWRKKLAKCVHDSKADTFKLCFEGISIAPKLLRKPMESWTGQPVHPRGWTEGLALPYRHSPSLAPWSMALLAKFCTWRLPSIRFPTNLPAFKVNTPWDKHKALRILSQLSAVNPFQHLKANTEAFM